MSNYKFKVKKNAQNIAYQYFVRFFLEMYQKRRHSQRFAALTALPHFFLFRKSYYRETKFHVNNFVCITTIFYLWTKLLCF